MPSLYITVYVKNNCEENLFFFIYVDFLHEVWAYWKSWHAYHYWFPNFVSSKGTTLFTYRYIMLSKLTRFFVKVWILVWKNLIKYRCEPIYLTFFIDCTNKNQMGKVVQFNLLQWIVILCFININIISLISKSIQNYFDMFFYQPFLTKRTAFIKIVLNVTHFHTPSAFDI